MKKRFEEQKVYDANIDFSVEMTESQRQWLTEVSKMKFDEPMRDDFVNWKKMMQMSWVKKHNIENANKPKNSKEQGYSLKWPTYGMLPDWELYGVVQEVASNEKYEVDYIRFCINKPDSKFYEVFAVSVPFELNVELEPGDKVFMHGTIRTWPSSEGRKIELIADAVEPWAPEEQSKLRKKNETPFD